MAPASTLVRTMGSSPRGRGKQVASKPGVAGHGLIPAWAGKTGGQNRHVCARRAHPRVGGENRRLPLLGPRVRGSSPRGRGKRRASAFWLNVGGLIPAWAGKTMGGLSTRCDIGAHPRVGGENATAIFENLNSIGSSPRGRGKRRGGVSPGHGDRLIPAWAGKTKQRRRLLGGERAHPRVGGENSLSDTTNTLSIGSSPRGRGKRQPFTPLDAGERLIPAWAGKTGSAANARSWRTAHPRVGGENALTVEKLENGAGSSPRGRGKHQEFARSVPSGRLIPAWAGKTGVNGWPPLNSAAHPRVGGENPEQITKIAVAAGSSPRGRGKRTRSCGTWGVSGLIPAWAGKTTRPDEYAPYAEAHPRVGGENPAQRQGQGLLTGSSPRGRGKPLRAAGCDPIYGLIPAWAGKTLMECLS